jgi:hypothetical protein
MLNFVTTAVLAAVGFTATLSALAFVSEECRHLEKERHLDQLAKLQIQLDDLRVEKDGGI